MATKATPSACRSNAAMASRPAPTARRAALKVRPCIGIWVQIAPTLVAEAFKFVEVFPGVHPCQVVEFRLGCGDADNLIVKMEIADPIHHGEDSPWLLRVKLSPVMRTGARWSSQYQHSTAPWSASVNG
jgi:hypothetical protein